jgi:hypothetical protein
MWASWFVFVCKPVIYSLVHSYDFNGNRANYFTGNSAINVDVETPLSAIYSFWATRTAKSETMAFNKGAVGQGPDLFYACGTISWKMWDTCQNEFTGGSLIDPSVKTGTNTHWSMTLIQVQSCT